MAGRRFHMFSVIDIFTKENLLSIVDASLSGHRVVRELKALILWRGRLDSVTSDNRMEFTSNIVPDFCDKQEINWHYIEPGKLSQNEEGKKKVWRTFLRRMIAAMLRVSLAEYGTSF